MCAFMAACWGLHKKGSLYDGLLRALTRAAETLHEQERLHRIAGFLAAPGSRCWARSLLENALDGPWAWQPCWSVATRLTK